MQQQPTENEAFRNTPATYGFRSTGLDRGKANQPGCAVTAAEPSQSTGPAVHTRRGFSGSYPASSDNLISTQIKLLLMPIKYQKN